MAQIDEPEIIDAGAIAAPAGSDGTGEWLRILLWRIVVAVGVLTVWQAVSGRLIDRFWISSPWEIAVQLESWTVSGALWLHLRVTLTETLLGFFFGAITGVAVGLVLGLNRRVALVLDPFIIALYSLPKIALAPLFILWFGIGLTSKVVLSTFIVFFLVFYSTYSGTLEVDQELVDVLRLMGARRGQIMTKATLPSVMIWIFTGMKISVPYALIGAVTGEIISSNRGIGYLIEAAAGQYDTGGVFAALVVLMIIATALHSLLKRSESIVMRWKETER